MELLELLGVKRENLKPTGEMRLGAAVKKGGKVEDEPAVGCRQPCRGSREPAAALGEG